ncbi:MAG: hypothetical protein GXP49_17675 [Deltaproteobacteria bacterium]|nr:hypothetical protein [Deltaproteobacteria bacterium]
MGKSSVLPVVFLVLFTCGISSCSKPMRSGDEQYPYSSMTKYLDALRWKNYQGASQYWLPTRRDKWLEDREAEEDLVNYQNYSIHGIKPLGKEGKVQARARVAVYRNDRLVLEKKTLLLTWEKVAGTWFIVKEEWIASPQNRKSDNYKVEPSH